MPGRSKSEREFISEVEEILERMRSDLLDLGDGSEEPEPALVNRLFRSAHSLKGLSGLFGLEHLAALAHQAEEVLDGLRMGRVPLDASAQALLDDAVSCFAAHLESVGNEERAASSDAAVAELMRRIRDWATSHEGPRDELAQLELDPGLVGALTEYEEHRLRENLRRGRALHVVEVAYDLQTFDAALSALSEAARGEGELLSTLPSPGATPGEEIRFSLLIASDLDAAGLATRLDLPAGSVRAVAVATPSARERPAAPAAGGPGPALSAASPTAPAVAEATPEIGSLRSLGETVRVDIRKLDELMNLVGELGLLRRGLGALAARIAEEPGLARLSDEFEKLDAGIDQKLAELRAGVLEVRMVPLRQVFEKLSRVVRRLRRDAEKQVRLELRGAETELDKLIVEQLVDPLVHVVRNAFDHALEPAEERSAAGKPVEGRIRIEALQRGNDVLIQVSDDGRGIDLEAVRRRAVERGLIAADAPLSPRETLELVFAPGLSTRDAVSETSGRGVGMDVLRANVNALGGLVELDSKPGTGTTVTLTLPVTLAIVQALVLRVGEQRFAIPLNAVHETVLIAESELQRSRDRELLDVRGEPLQVRRLARELGLEECPDAAEKRHVVVVGIGEARLGLIVDGLAGQQDAVIKPLQGPLRHIRGISGATELGDGQPVLVVDVGALVEDALRGRDAT